jgi:hypothetical protein
MGVSFTVNGMDPDDTLYREYHGIGMPTSYFIDRDGVVTRIVSGFMRIDEMEQAVNEAISSATAAGALR